MQLQYKSKDNDAISKIKEISSITCVGDVFGVWHVAIAFNTSTHRHNNTASQSV